MTMMMPQGAPEQKASFIFLIPLASPVFPGLSWTKTQNKINLRKKRKAEKNEKPKKPKSRKKNEKPEKNEKPRKNRKAEKTKKPQQKLT